MNHLLGWPAVVLIWGLALGMALWASGADIALVWWLEAHYNQTFNSWMHYISMLGLGRMQVQLCLLVGLGVGLASRRLRPAVVPALLLRWIIGVFDQFVLLARGRAEWTRFWRELPYTARVWLLAVPVMGFSGLAQLVFKMVFGRPRPKEMLWNGHSPHDVQPLGFDASFWSFPSGHATSTFTICVLLACAFPRWRWPLLAAATVLASSRFLALTPHYMGDVVAGAGLGSAVALTVAAAMRIRPHG